ncbi:MULTISPECIES: SDR family NAD(P)-dependent oxidoreductase [Streptomyces]|uniref:SDR family NAD(P)-dependent oxidoreductase n=2 Tax=Streptomyces TaxID=1883 RepID=A0ABV9J841_9ACTN
MTTRLTTRFTAQSTATEVVSGVALPGRRVVVTGATSGIGLETARALASAGAEVTVAVRNPAAGERAAQDIIADTGNKDVLVASLDLADQDSVATFVAGWYGPLHILVNNAGVMEPQLTRTPEGWELHFATNHYGHFALTTGLHQALAAAGDARVVSVSSSQHRLSPVVFDDIHFERRPYDPQTAYGQSKTANVLFAVEAARRWAGVGVTVNAVMPGAVHTNLTRHINPEPLAHYEESGAPQLPWKTAEQGAATSVLAATSPLLDGASGRYFEDCNEAEPLNPDNFHGGVAGYALDPDDAARLWDVSTKAVSGR